MLTRQDTLSRRRSPERRKQPSPERKDDDDSEVADAGHRYFGGGEGREILEVGASVGDGPTEERWSQILPELLGEIVRRLESSEDGRWPARKSVVSCGGVCRRWREVTSCFIGPPRETGKITFPRSLKQPGPRDFPIQCYIKRNKRTSSYYLYLSLSETLLDRGKFLLAAQRFRHGTSIEYVISLDADNLSERSKAYVGKVRSGFMGTRFTIYDSSPACNDANLSCSRASRRFSRKQISPQVPVGNFKIGLVSYKLNLLKTRGPRRMLCTMQSSEGINVQEQHKMSMMGKSGLSTGSLVLKNKAPRWHDNLQCWCLNFHGRVTIASVKNFQLVAASDPCQAGGIGSNETVLLQFGKVGDDIFTMDYREPLSTFQAFAICLTSFGTKLACQ